MHLNVQRPRHWVPAAQISEESRVWRRIHCPPLAVVVNLPRDVVEDGWRVLRLGDHSDHETPRLVLLIPHQIVLEHVRLTNHNLQHSGHITDDCDCTS